jgi:hypothetical protein
MEYLTIEDKIKREKLSAQEFAFYRHCEARLRSEKLLYQDVYRKLTPKGQTLVQETFKGCSKSMGNELEEDELEEDESGKKELREIEFREIFRQVYLSQVEKIIAADEDQEIVTRLRSTPQIRFILDLANFFYNKNKTSFSELGKKEFLLRYAAGVYLANKGVEKEILGIQLFHLDKELYLKYLPLDPFYDFSSGPGSISFKKEVLGRVEIKRIEVRI